MGRNTSPALPKSDPTAALIRNVIHPLWAKHAHPTYARYLREFEQNQYLHPDDLRKLQMQRLRQQLVYAYRYVPLYRLRMTQAGLTPLDIQTHDDLRLLPVLTRRDLLDHQDLLVSSNVPAGKRQTFVTGGSTGSPAQFYVDDERSDSRMASRALRDAWTGLRPGDWYADFSAPQSDFGDRIGPYTGWRQRLLSRNLTLQTAELDEVSMGRYVETLRRFRPRHMLAHTQAALLFAEFCRTNEIHDISFDAIIVSTQVLLPVRRALLESTFRGKVFNRYGCREVGLIGSECEFHSGLHVNADALLVEVEASPLLPHGMGRVLVTDLLNRSMPLVRYDVGDVALLDDPLRCPCGRSLPLMGDIQGRASEFLHVPSGRMTTVPSLASLAADARDARESQFTRPDPWHGTLQVVAGTGHVADGKEELRRRLLPESGGPVDLRAVTAGPGAAEASGTYGSANL